MRPLDVSPSYEEERPEISWDDHQQYDWYTIGEVALANMPVSEYPRHLEIQVDAEDATEWHGYSAPGTTGVFSEEFLDSVGPQALRLFTKLPIAVNSCPYYFLRPTKRIACVDLSRSQYITFPHDHSRIMNIDHCEFTDAVPSQELLFEAEEQYWLLATPSLIDRLGRFKGILYTPVP